MRDTLLIAAVFVASLLGFARPVFGVLAFTFLGFFNPHSFAWSFARSLPLSQVVAISTICGIFFSSQRKRLPMQRETALLLGLWTAFGISTIFAIFPDHALAKFVLISKILLMVFCSTLVINSEDRGHSLLRVIAFSLGFYAVKGGIFAILTGGNYLVYGPSDSFLTANNSIGLALAMNVPILAYLLGIEKRRWLRHIIRAMLLLSYPAIICTYSRGAWLGLAMATALIILKSRRKFLVVPLVGILAVILQTAVPRIAPDRLIQRYDTLVNYEDDASAESRFWNWEFCKRVGMAHPLTGGGFDFYSIELYATYYPEFLQRWPGKSWSCHSMWFTVFGEHGFPGLVLWIALLISCFSSLRRMRVYGRTYPQFAWMCNCADALQGALVTFMVVGSFLDSAYFDMFYYLVAMIVILKNAVQHSPATESVLQPAAVYRPTMIAGATVRQ